MAAISGLMHCTNFASLDHLVDAAQRRQRHGETERLRSLEIDNQIKLGRLLDRNVGRLGAANILSMSADRRHSSGKFGP